MKRAIETRENRTADVAVAEARGEGPVEVGPAHRERVRRGAPAAALAPLSGGEGAGEEAAGGLGFEQTFERGSNEAQRKRGIPVSCCQQSTSETSEPSPLHNTSAGKRGPLSSRTFECSSVQQKSRIEHRTHVRVELARQVHVSHVRVVVQEAQQLAPAHNNRYYTHFSCVFFSRAATGIPAVRVRGRRDRGQRREEEKGGSRLTPSTRPKVRPITPFARRIRSKFNPVICRG